MNAKELQKILNQPKSIDATTALEIIQLSKDFPYFAWPYAALTAFQLEKNDFRLENTLHQTSLRIHNRQWLQDYLFKSSNAVNKTEEPVLTEDSESEFEPELTEDSETEAINPSLEALEEDFIELKLDTPEDDEIKSLPIEESESLNNVASQPLEPIKPKLVAPIYNLEDLFPVPAPEPNEKKMVASSDFYAWLNAGIEQKNTPNNKPLERKEDLIEKFLKNRPSISRPKQEFFTPEKAMKKSEVLSNKIVTETLANIYNKQGNFEKAIEAYEQLSLKFPEKKPYFADLIDQIKKENNLS